jgi:hypothetical protein
MAEGSFRVRNGRSTLPGLHDLPARVTETAARLLAELAPARALAARLEPHVVAFAEAEAAFPLPLTRFIPPEPPCPCA